MEGYRKSQAPYSWECPSPCPSSSSLGSSDKSLASCQPSQSWAQRFHCSHSSSLSRRPSVLREHAHGWVHSPLSFLASVRYFSPLVPYWLPSFRTAASACRDSYPCFLGTSSHCPFLFPWDSLDSRSCLGTFSIFVNESNNPDFECKCILKYFLCGDARFWPLATHKYYEDKWHTWQIPSF